MCGSQCIERTQARRQTAVVGCGGVEHGTFKQGAGIEPVLTLQGEAYACSHSPIVSVMIPVLSSMHQRQSLPLSALPYH